jgi:alpha-tubulin suppressor-like RCC1 family protein
MTTATTNSSHSSIGPFAPTAAERASHATLSSPAKRVSMSLCAWLCAGLLSISAAEAADGGFSFGRNWEGQLGLGSISPGTSVPTAINTSNLTGLSLIQVSAGTLHSLALADDGNVFSFGWNINGRTGLGTTSGNTLVPAAINTSNLGSRSIVQVSAGAAHNLLLADDGTVFSFGSNDHGRTGRDTSSGETTVATMIDTRNLGGRSIVQVSAGFFHSLLLADDGTVFSFGWNSSGRTGLGTTSGNTTVATLIDTSNLSDRSIVQVDAGALHSLVLADDGSVFSFGSNLSGRTGLGTSSGETLIATMIDTRHLDGRSITQVSGTDSHNLLLAEDGSVFSFGSNVSGRTGLGISSSNTTIARMILPGDVPPGWIVTDISAGGWHSLVIAVPEPATASLLLGIGGFLLSRRRGSRAVIK